MKKQETNLRLLQSLLQKIPAGKVTTYAALATAMNMPRAARAIGTLCGKNDDLDTYPCYKVVKSDGTVGHYALGTAEKIHRLKKDGIPIQNGRVQKLSQRMFAYHE